MTIFEDIRCLKKTNLYILCVLLFILNSSYTWFTREIYNGVIVLLVAFINIISFLVTYRNRYRLDIKSFLLFISICLSGFFARYGLNGILLKIAYCIPIFTFLLLKEEDLRDVIDVLNQILYIMIFTSLILWGFDRIGISLFNIGYGEYKMYEYINHVLYVDVLRYEGAFCGFTYEAGYISVLCVCLLVITGYNFKKFYTWVYMIAIICSLSLGGYLLGTIGYIVMSFYKNNGFNSKAKFVLGIIIFLAIIVIGALTYNGGNNILAVEIINRLAFDSELGIVGNNRENFIAREIVDSFFYSDQVWLGIGEQAFAHATDVEGFDMCSWRGYVVTYGAVCTLIFFFYYNTYFYKRVQKPFVMTALVVFWLDFLQHGTLYSESLYLFTAFLCLHAYDNKNNSCEIE